MKKYYFKYMTKKSGTVLRESLHFGEEHETIRELSKGVDIISIFSNLLFIDAYRVSFMSVDELDKRTLIVDSKNNKIKIELNELKIVA